MAVNQLVIDTTPFIEFYRKSDRFFRAHFIEALTLAARQEAERYQLRELMKKRIQQNELGISAQLDPKQLNGFLYHCGLIDMSVALTVLDEVFDYRVGATEEYEEEDPIPMLNTAQMVNQPPVRWLVEKLIPEDSFTLIAGEYGAGKSFVMLDVAFHVALGVSWHGNKVEQGSVVYLASEGSRGLQKRMEAWMIKRELDIDEPIPLYTIPQAIDLTNPFIFKKLLNKIPQDTKLMIIDTLHTFMDGDENSAQDVKPLLDTIRQLNRNGIAVAVVHHLNKSGSIRGSNSIPAGADAVFEVKRDDVDTKRIQIKCTKQKDFDKDDCADLFFRMETISLETEHDTSVVLMLDENRTRKKEDAIPLTPKFKEVLKYIYANPGANKKEIIEGTFISTNTWLRARKRLLEMNLIQEKVRGQYYPAKR